MIHQMRAGPTAEFEPAPGDAKQILPGATIVIRAKDEERAIGRTLAILGAQTVAADVVVVDSGSSDATVALAREAGARVVEIPPASFTYGYALNVGCAVARTEVVVALSAHAYPPDDRWLERLLGWFRDPTVACVCGSELGPYGEQLPGSVVQDRARFERTPFWGYSNSDGGFRRELWARRPFREDMPFSEDKEWAWHWLGRGWRCVVDPSLTVDHDVHHTEPLRTTYVRARLSFEGYSMYLDLGRWGLRDLALEAWRDRRRFPERYRTRSSSGERAARLIGRYGARMAGRYAGQRAGAARRRSQRAPASG